MGGVGDFFFGSKSKEKNVNNELLTSKLSPGLDSLTKGEGLMGSLLGANGGPAQTAALENYANSGGMQFLMDQGQKAVTSSKAASGLLKSGSYGTALEKYGQGLASTYLNQYMSNLNDYAKLGLGAGGVLASSGQYAIGPKQGLIQTLAGNAGIAAAAAGA